MSYKNPIKPDYSQLHGCMLGKTVEGMRRHELVPFLQGSGNYPMLS